MEEKRASAARYELAANTIGDRETEAAIEVLRSGRVTMGHRVRRFEEAFAEWVGADYAVMTNSGSSANLIATEARMRGVRVDQRRWQTGDEVLVPALAWPTTVWPLAQLGLVPILVDIDPVTLAIDLDSARAMITPRTVGMFLIHVLGQAPDMAEYVRFCDNHDLVLVEDACESLGTHSGGQHVGTFGETGTFSTYFSHHITTIEGGVVITSDEAVHNDLKSMRSHGWVRDRSDRDDLARQAGALDDHFLFVTTGYNVRPTEINAAIGLVQLERLPAMIESRAELAGMVAAWAKKIPWLRIIGSEQIGTDDEKSGEWRSHSWMTLPLVVDESAPVGMQGAADALEAAGIETRPIIAGNLMNHPAMRQITHRSAPELPNTDRVFSRGFMIGCHPFSTPDQHDIIEAAFSRLAAL